MTQQPGVSQWLSDCVLAGTRYTPERYVESASGVRFEGHDKYISCILLHDDRTIFTGSGDNTARQYAYSAAFVAASPSAAFSAAFRISGSAPAFRAAAAVVGVFAAA